MSLSTQRERRYKDEKMNCAVKELDKYRKRQRDIESMSYSLDECREQYCALEAMKFDLTRVQGGERRDKLVEVALKWADLDVAISEKKAEAEKELWLIKLKLDKLSALQAQVLELYYIKCYTIVKIARILEYSEEGIKTIKYNALKMYANL